MRLLDELNTRLRFGMKPGLDGMRMACAAINHPERKLRGVIHVAGTNGKGAVCAILDACLRAVGFCVGRYTSPHLVRINERFFLDGEAVSDERLNASVPEHAHGAELTYFELLTLTAFKLYAEADPDFTVLETGLGGRLDATNVCLPCLTVITRIGLDHCDWLGDTVEKIAVEKAGIIKPGVPIVLGENVPSVRTVIAARAHDVGAPFYYAPDDVSPFEVPSDFSLDGRFNRENAVTALAALKVLSRPEIAGLDFRASLPGFSRVGWPGRFQRVGDFIVDGAHNPPAARALTAALAEAGFGAKSLTLICGFCGDKDVDDVLRILSPFVIRAFAVKTNNPRSLTAEATAAKLAAAGLSAEATPSLADAIRRAQGHGSHSFDSKPQAMPDESRTANREPRTTNHEPRTTSHEPRTTLICGSLFLAGEALVELRAQPWGESVRFDAAERLK